ncbi:patatin-like phospholipase family protein [Taklimakanibacter lacteus]|uniref:patatin-like phospholipase family protein n=1 Tax=Taklimakanibacter lacteus TaxID=2268456 RepID=UPI000E65ED8F
MDQPVNTVTQPAPRKTVVRQVKAKTLNLALQGGGAHGAFTWGVLDRLLEEPRLDFEGIVATSAGAMNAAVMTYGLIEGGRDGAQKALANFWRRVSHAAAFSPIQPTPLDRLTGNRSLENSPPYIFFDLVTRLMSPYQFNPLNINPLRRVLEQSMDFEALRSARCKFKLNICATNVRTGKVKVFSNDDITCDAVMASACLPFLFRAVEIGEDAYWDGGYMGNPAIFPLIYGCESPDVLIVHINPMARPELPRTATEIMNRINEISFNSSLMREMRAIDFVTQLIDQGTVCGMTLKRMLIHAISADDIMLDLGVASKLNADWEFLTELRDAGRMRAESWLTSNYDHIGKQSTVDIHNTYL